MRSTLEYSRAELHQKTRTLKKGYRAGFLLIFVLLLALFAALWWNGVFNIVHRSESPDRANLLTVYDRDIAINRFSREPRITVRTDYPPGEGWSTVIYSGTFQGAWWSPDSDKFVLAFQDEETHRLVLHGHTTHSTSNLNAYLSIALEQSELGKYDFQDCGDIFPEVEYQFLQWSLDSRAMLIYYSFTDTSQMFHEGYFWYNLETGTAIAPLELG